VRGGALGRPFRDVGVAAEAGELPLEADQPGQPTGVVDDGEAPLTVPDQPHPDVLSGLVQCDRPAVQTGAAERGRGVVAELGEVGADERAEQSPTPGDQGHVEVVVREERAGVGHRRGGQHRLRGGHHHVFDGEPRERGIGRGHVPGNRRHLASFAPPSAQSALCTPQ
jgi:hypothetical protein